MDDKQFTTTLMVVIGVLIGSTVGILALANVLISDADYSEDTVIQANIEDRIKPVGSLTVNGEAGHVADAMETSTSDTQPEQVANASFSAEQLYTQSCNACHATGLLNAPKYGDHAGWRPRIEAGVDQIYANAINGKGAMQPKGGRIDFSDDDIKKIVDYMLESVQ